MMRMSRSGRTIAAFIVGAGVLAALAWVAPTAQAAGPACGLVCQPGEVLDPLQCECVPREELQTMPPCMLVCREPGQVVDPFHCRCVDEGTLSDLLRRMRKKSR